MGLPDKCKTKQEQTTNRPLPQERDEERDEEKERPEGKRMYEERCSLSLLSSSFCTELNLVRIERWVLRADSSYLLG